MFWIAVSMFVMSMTGLGDDTRPFLDFLARMEEAALVEVKDPDRQKKVLNTIAETRGAFRNTRAELGSIGDCIERVDRRYSATRADYERCMVPSREVMDRAATALIRARHELQAVTSVDERARVRAKMVTR